MPVGIPVFLTENIWGLIIIHRFFIILEVVGFMLAVLLDGILYRILHLILHPI